MHGTRTCLNERLAAYFHCESYNDMLEGLKADLIGGGLNVYQIWICIGLERSIDLNAYQICTWLI